ncbi:DJ-1/PfpI family protein [Gudongella sp. DL1XJH-153]|uniref:DJ-1/PfpI family protein n=1 Tax=Gudongella sp. DL1XJH-153 TaxID=3409804 RepID=UPI003BB66A50
MIVNILLFDDFETLDVFGPVEVFGNLPYDYSLKYLSRDGGLIKSRHCVEVKTETIDGFSEDGILFIPGGYGTRPLVEDESYVNMVKDLCERSKYCLTVCTGSALLAKTGLLKGLNATSNKLSFDWVVSVDPEVQWLAKARWAVDGKYWTSSGVSAGIDMALAFVEQINGRDDAEKISKFMEYIWNENKDNDPFSTK